MCHKGSYILTYITLTKSLKQLCIVTLTFPALDEEGQKEKGQGGSSMTKYDLRLGRTLSMGRRETQETESSWSLSTVLESAAH